MKNLLNSHPHKHVFSNGSKSKLWHSAAPLILGAILACLLLPYCFGRKKIKFEEAALMEGTSSILASIEGVPIHFTSINKIPPCLEGIYQRKLAQQAVWFGNSQLHAVNQFKQGQENAPFVLFHYLNKKNVDLLTFSCPNINFQEYYIMFEYLRSQIPIDYLILSTVFDDTREDNIRQDLKGLINSENHAKKPNPNYGINFHNLTINIQERSEKFLNKWLRSRWRIWQLRPQARGKIFLQLYYLRNFLFRINPQTKRPKILGRYITNMKALETILSIASNTETRVLVYIVPTRNDVEIPYILDEYNQFKQEVEELTVAYGAIFANLEGIVPPNCWGQKESTVGKKQLELDFMHFQAKGHKILADKLIRILNENFLTQSVDNEK